MLEEPEIGAKKKLKRVLSSRKKALKNKGVEEKDFSQAIFLPCEALLASTLRLSRHKREFRFADSWLLQKIICHTKYL